jgi:signal transduction histidine kinase
MQDSYKEVAIVLIAGSFMLLVFSGVAIFAIFLFQKKRFQHHEQMAAIQRELLHARLETQEETFQQISAELHDNFGQLLGSARILLEVAQRYIDQPPENLRAEADRINGSQPIHVGLLAPANLLFLNTDQQIIVFRIVQEAIHNSLKHSGASEVRIDIEIKDGHLQIRVTDNGSGFDRSEISHSGMGIRNMERRAKVLGGTMHWCNIPKGGTRVELLLPSK